jgi:hypothetical protein
VGLEEVGDGLWDVYFGPITSEADLREGVDRLNDATGTKRRDNLAHANADAKPQSA